MNNSKAQQLVEVSDYITPLNQDNVVVGLVVQDKAQKNKNFYNGHHHPSNQPYLQNQQHPYFQQNQPQYQVPIAPQQGYNQGFQPSQYNMPPPPQQIQVIAPMPGYISVNHPQYQFILEQSRIPCPICHYQGVDYVELTPGCTTFAWSVGLFCLTSFICFWVPFVCDSCKDIKISCSRCRRTKCVIQKSCC